MASYKRKFPFDEGIPQHNPSSNHPSKAAPNRTVSRVSKRQSKGYSQYLTSDLEPTFDLNEVFPAFAHNSEVQQMLSWTASVAETEFSNQTARSWTQFDLSEEHIKLDGFFLEDGLFGRSSQEPSIAVSVDNSGFQWNGLQPTSESLSYLLSPTNITNSNTDSYIDCHPVVEGSYLGEADSGTMIASWEHIVPPFVTSNEILPVSFWADFQSVTTPVDVNLGDCKLFHFHH